MNIRSHWQNSFQGQLQGPRRIVRKVMETRVSLVYDIEPTESDFRGEIPWLQQYLPSPVIQRRDRLGRRRGTTWPSGPRSSITTYTLHINKEKRWNEKPNEINIGSKTQRVYPVSKGCVRINMGRYSLPWFVLIDRELVRIKQKQFFLS